MTRQKGWLVGRHPAPHRSRYVCHTTSSQRRESICDSHVSSGSETPTLVLRYLECTSFSGLRPRLALQVLHLGKAHGVRQGRPVSDGECSLCSRSGRLQSRPAHGLDAKRQQIIVLHKTGYPSVSQEDTTQENGEGEQRQIYLPLPP